ncbi:SMP-LTD domain-containing protein [Mycena indigotica]|uniref:SMP-LTD domain-containing protein n=1 Tax=Mycena indigotica TaxID=2126181 RepID=A0A8H6W661_9AGAR|nr:SMP-LTD domain-containing protein [Mycena indigotica]KAF7307274.1 SMP-LTD domain-containing protein [Mycena indigotica]
MWLRNVTVSNYHNVAGRRRPRCALCMTLKALFYAYILGGITFLPLLIAAFVYFTIYTSVPVGDPDGGKKIRTELAEKGAHEEEEDKTPALDVNDAPKTRKAWLTMRRTFEESTDGSYVTLVRSFLDARSKDPKRSRPKDMWYVVLKGSVLYLYEDESMSECEGAIELSGHDVTIFPEGLMDGELFAKRNAICLKPKIPPEKGMPSVTREMHSEGIDVEARVAESGAGAKKAEKIREVAEEEAKQRDAAREQALNPATPWFIFVRSNFEMEDWYMALIHASDNPPQTPMLTPLQNIFQPSDMAYLVNTLDEQPDVIPMRWLNALLGRIFFSFYRTHNLEAEIIRRIMKKLSKVKRPAFLTEINVTEVSVGNKAPTFSKPMLKELTKEGDASMEVHLQYKGEVRITVEATATISLGSRFKSYEVKLVLAAVLKEIEGNLLVKIKRPPSNRIWYAFTQAPRMVFEVEPIVSDRQITWSMITSTLESSLKTIIAESVVLPNMDDISFFESAGHSHRGGIWPDAARREKAPADVAQSQPQTQPPPQQLPSEDDAGSVVSAPPAAVPTSTVESEPRATQSAVDLPISSSPPDVPEVSWSSTFSTGDGPELKKKRSWFSAARSEGGRSEGGRSFTEQDVFADEDEAPRGRAGTMDAEKTTNQRSRSTPHPSDVAASTSSEGSDDSHLQPPSSRGHVKSNSVEEYPAGGSEPSTSLPRSATGGSPTTPSFLSTLRSRDKQAISNTAKETFRKWGANWGGLMKDKDKDGNGGEEVPDHGSLISRLRPETNNNGNMSHKARQSYAEVRAAVAERRGRERSDGNTSPGPETTSTPIPVPEIRERAVSMVPGRPANGFTSLIPRSATSAVDNTPSTPMPESPSPIHVQPQAKSMVIPGIHAKNRGAVMSMGYIAPDPPSPPDTRSKNPTIQNMYRLWKSPSAAAEIPPPEASTSSSPPPALIEGSNTSPLPPVVSLPAPDSPSPPPRPTPALPPRSGRTASLSHIARPDLAPRLSDSQPQASASEALQSIANKDNDKRASLEAAFSSPPNSRRGTLSSASAAALVSALSAATGEEEPA